jgi:hypothetical protein
MFDPMNSKSIFKYRISLKEVSFSNLYVGGIVYPRWDSYHQMQEKYKSFPVLNYLGEGVRLGCHLRVCGLFMCFCYRRVHFSLYTVKNTEAMLEVNKDIRLGVNAEEGKYTRVYPEVSGLATCNANFKWYNSLPLGAVVPLFCESV